MIKTTINSIIEHRIKKLPFTNILKDSLMGVGALFGGIYGLSNGIRHENGVIWKPFLGVVGGGVLGFTVGLFPFHTFGIVLIGDVANTIHINYKLKKMKT
jgi:hypothetical protein